MCQQQVQMDHFVMLERSQCLSCHILYILLKMKTLFTKSGKTLLHLIMIPIKIFALWVVSIARVLLYRAFVNTRLLVHKHVKISVDEWILETTRPQKHVKFLEQYIP